MTTQKLLLIAGLMAMGAMALENRAFLQANGTPDVEAKPYGTAAFHFTPVSTTMKCVINLMIQFMLVYTALAIVRTYGELTGNTQSKKLPIQESLEFATYSVAYAPILCVLFIACRMRVLQMTKGRGNPPDWVQNCMLGCTYSILAVTICALVIPLFTGEMLKVDPKTGDMEGSAKGLKNPMMATGFTVLRYCILLGLYGGFIGVVVGIVTFEPPAGTWKNGEMFPVSPAVACTINLSIQYMLVYAAVSISRTYRQFTNPTGESKFEQVMLTATASMNMAPMLCILFLGARMRALQMDPVHGNPQRWAQDCFYMISYAILLQTCLAIAVPLVMNEGIPKPAKEFGGADGDMKYEVKNPTLGLVLTVCRYAVMLCVYIGFTMVCVSVFLIEHPNGPEYTPSVSPTMQCVLNLTCQFFTVYLLLWIFITVREHTGTEFGVIKESVEAAKATVQFCPMLSILFVGTRMRALQISNNKGAPQGWAQDGMYLCTWAIFIQFSLCLVIPIFTGTAAKCDDDGNVIWKPKNEIALYVAVGLKWVTWLMLYGGIITVITSVFLITKETANGRGSIPLAGDVVKSPTGPNDVIGEPADNAFF